MTNTHIARFTILILVVMLGGCAARNDIPDGPTLASDEGFLVVNISSNMKGGLGYDVYSDSALPALFSGWGGAAVRLRRGKNFFVRRVKAGEYMWTGLSTGSASFKFRGRSVFRVKPGTINYLGHIQLKTEFNTIHMTVVDNETGIKDRLQRTHPEYITALPFYNARTLILY